MEYLQLILLSPVILRQKTELFRKPDTLINILRWHKIKRNFDARLWTVTKMVKQLALFALKIYHTF